MWYGFAVAVLQLWIGSALALLRLCSDSIRLHFGSHWLCSGYAITLLLDSCGSSRNIAIRFGFLSIHIIIDLPNNIETLMPQTRKVIEYHCHRNSRLQLFAIRLYISKFLHDNAHPCVRPLSCDQSTGTKLVIYPLSESILLLYENRAIWLALLWPCSSFELALLWLCPRAALALRWLCSGFTLALIRFCSGSIRLHFGSLRFLTLLWNCH